MLHTGSPKAARLLAQKSRLPFLRIQPVNFQSTVESIWQSVPVRPAPALPATTGEYIGIPAAPAAHYA
jgi:hypothetical protein